MINKQIKSWLIIVGAAFLVISCSNNDNNKNTHKSRHSVFNSSKKSEMSQNRFDQVVSEKTRKTPINNSYSDEIVINEEVTPQPHHEALVMNEPNTIISYQENNSDSQPVQYGQDHTHSPMNQSYKSQQPIYGYNKDGRINPIGSLDVIMSGSFIYWNVKENNLDLGNDYVSESNLREANTINMDFKYKPGFKAALGLGFNYDNWSLLADYTNLRGSNSVDHTRPLTSYYIKALWFITTASDISRAIASWKYNYQMFNLSLVKKYYVGEKLIIGQTLGVKGGWLNQRYNIDYLSTITRSSHAKTNSWLIGPRMALDTDWILGKGFKIFGNLGISILYQKFTTNKIDQYDPSAAQYNIYYKDNGVTQAKPNYEILAGLEWGSYFANNKAHFLVSAAYEFQQYFTQNMMRNLVAKSYNSNSYITGVTPNGDFMFYGLTATMRFDY